MPISAIDGCSEGHWQNVKSIIEEAVGGLGLDVSLVSDADEVGIIQARIIQNIYDNEIVVCDVSCKNPNVMFELGMRLAFDKPTVVIKDDLTSYSFDTSPLEHLTYPRTLHYNQIQDFKSQLKFKVEKTLASAAENGNTFLKNFGKFVVAKIDNKEVGKDEFFAEKLNLIFEEIRMLKVSQTSLRSDKASFADKVNSIPVSISNSTIFDFLKKEMFIADEITRAKYVVRNSEEFKRLLANFRFYAAEKKLFSSEYDSISDDYVYHATTYIAKVYYGIIN